MQFGKNIRLTKLKRGQEEIVGFVVVVLLVCVVILVFLGLSLRGNDPGKYKDNNEIQHFLSSMDKVTSNCSFTFEPDYAEIGELAKECRSSKLCLNGEDSCKVFKAEVRKWITSSWNIANESSTRGYIFNASYKASNTSVAEDFISDSKGNCINNKRGAILSLPDGSVNIELKLVLCD